MATVHDLYSDQFYNWELRGRGWKVFDDPVYPEPPFQRFRGHFLEKPQPVDDGLRKTLLSSLMERLTQKVQPKIPQPVPDEEEEPEPRVLVRDSLIELKTSLPANLKVSDEAAEQFLQSLSLCRDPIAFELLGRPGEITLQFVADKGDAPLVRRQLEAQFSEAYFQARESTLDQIWNDGAGEEILVVEFGLAREFMFSLGSGKLDPFVGIIGALTELQAKELALFQVLFEPVREPWSESIAYSVTHQDGSSFFVNTPELAHAAKEKIRRPLFAAVVRIAVGTETFERTLQIARDLAGSLRVFANPQGNELIPLDNADYPFEKHIEDVIARQSRRAGMILNCDELVGFVHLPSSAVRSASFLRETGKAKTAPKIVQGESGILLGTNVHAQRSISVRLTSEQRIRHMHILGASGTGKSTLLFNLICQDIQKGEGVGVLDPHGDLIDRVLTVIPAERISDVVLVDLSDEEYSVGFNILSAHSDLEKTLLASDLVSVFERLSTSWGDQLESVLRNAILAFLESQTGGTLSDLRRFLIEAAFREKFLRTVRDPDIVYYWRKGFVQLAGNKSIGSVLTRLETFLAPKPIRYMVSQAKNRLNFADILDTGKIFLAKLPQGQIGEQNAFLLGSLLVSKFQQLAMGRQAQKVEARRDFWLYIDEFHNFITPSMKEIITGARKYRLGLILAHQELKQLDRDRNVASSVLSTFTRVVFRVGDSDARALESGFSFFKARDLQNLATGEAICRVEKADCDFNLTIPNAVDSKGGEEVRRMVIAASRATYGTPRSVVEAELLRKYEVEEQKEPPPATLPRPEKPKPEKEIPIQTVPTAPVTPKPVIPEKTPEMPTIPTPESPQDSGKGGEQHGAIQQRIKEACEKLGYRAIIEFPIPGKKGIDVAILENEKKKIAVEIGIRTTIDHEVGNVLKCLRVEFPLVAVLTAGEAKLSQMREAVGATLGAELSQRVKFFLPDAFLDFLKSLPKDPISPPSPTETNRRGYKVKRSAPKLTPEEFKAREAGALRTLALTMKAKLK